MKIEIIKILRELNLRCPAEQGHRNIIWVDQNDVVSIDLNRSLDSIHGAVNGEQGYYLDEDRIWEVL